MELRFPWLFATFDIAINVRLIANRAAIIEVVPVDSAADAARLGFPELAALFVIGHDSIFSVFNGLLLVIAQEAFHRHGPSIT